MILFVQSSCMFFITYDNYGLKLIKGIQKLSAREDEKRKQQRLKNKTKPTNVY